MLYNVICIEFNAIYIIYRIYLKTYYFKFSLEGWHTSDPFSLFLYLCVNHMFATTGTEFSQFQPTRRIVSILLSNISGNTRWFLINTLLITTGTFQNNSYSDIFTLSHEPPLVGFLIHLTLLFFDSKRRRIRERK